MTILSAVITLILVMDPFGGIPVFLSLLKQSPARRRRLIILREMAIAPRMIFPRQVQEEDRGKAEEPISGVREFLLSI